MHLIITRHGETVENVQEIYQGQGLQGTLSENGKEQARKLSLRLRDQKIDAIFSSDLKRAADTAREVAKYHPDAEFHLVKELREVNIGDLSGKSKKEFAFKNRSGVFETDEQLIERVKKFLEMIYNNYKGKKVLFVGHGYVNRAIYAVLHNKGSEAIKSFEKPGNTAVTIVDVTEEDNTFHTISCTKHL